MAPSTQPKLLRLRQIIGDLNATPPIEPLIPVGRSTLLGWVQDGKFPPPNRIGRCTVWRYDDVRLFIDGGGVWPPKSNGDKEEAA